MRTIVIPPPRPRRGSTAPPPVPARFTVMRCIQIPSKNPLADLSDEAIRELIDHLDEDVAVIVDAPPRTAPCSEDVAVIVDARTR